jgi:DNA mismatch endonuclease, patch repair protein
MSRIRGRDSKIEVGFRRALWATGMRYRTHVRVMKGTPDLVMRRAQVVIFIDSCFWHHCRWHCRAPKSQRRFWLGKLRRNRARDVAVSRYYRSRGWGVIRIWEHQLRAQPKECVLRVLGEVNNRLNERGVSPLKRLR